MSQQHAVLVPALNPKMTSFQLENGEHQFSETLDMGHDWIASIEVGRIIKSITDRNPGLMKEDL